MQDNIKRGNIICFTEEQVERASEYAKGLAENYGLKTLLLNQYHDVVGALGQIAVEEKLEELHIDHISYSPYIPRQGGDNGDGKIFGETYDVKSKYIWEESYLDNIFGDCTILENDKNDVVEKGIVNYIFVNIFLGQEPKAFIVGGISTSDFWNTARRNDKLKMTGYSIKGMETKPFLDFIFH